MEIVNRWLWIILMVVVVLLLVNPNSNAKDVIHSLTAESRNNIKALQGNAPGPFG